MRARDPTDSGAKLRKGENTHGFPVRAPRGAQQERRELLDTIRSSLTSAESHAAKSHEQHSKRECRVQSVPVLERNGSAGCAECCRRILLSIEVHQGICCEQFATLLEQDRSPILHAHLQMRRSLRAWINSWKQRTASSRSQV